MIKSALPACLLLAAAHPVHAQETAPLPLPVERVEDRAQSYLPANTEVLLRMNQDITTKGRDWSEGDTFYLSVVHDVIHEGFVVIPRGSRAAGRITWLTSKGMFGKSGKMTIEMEYVEVAGHRIDLEGEYKQEGEGNTVATVGTVVVAGVFGALVTGRSGTIPQGRELMAWTQTDLPLAIPAASVGRRSNGIPVGSQGISSSPYMGMRVQ